MGGCERPRQCGCGGRGGGGGQRARRTKGRRRRTAGHAASESALKAAAAPRLCCAVCGSRWAAPAGRSRDALFHRTVPGRAPHARKRQQREEWDETLRARETSAAAQQTTLPLTRDGGCGRRARAAGLLGGRCGQSAEDGRGDRGGRRRGGRGNTAVSRQCLQGSLCNTGGASHSVLGEHVNTHGRGLDAWAIQQHTLQQMDQPGWSGARKQTSAAAVVVSAQHPPHTQT